MIHRPATPGLTFEVVEPPVAVDPLRTDIVAVVGPTERGPIGRPTRVAGWRAYTRTFGQSVAGAKTPEVIRACFANGAEAIWVTRVAGRLAAAARAEWTPGSALLAHPKYGFVARGAGRWGNGLHVEVRARARGRTGRPELDVTVSTPQGVVETHARLDPNTWTGYIERASTLIRVEPGLASTTVGLGGPRHQRWADIVLADGRDQRPGGAAYAAAIEQLATVDEPSIYLVPDLWTDLGRDEGGLAMCELIARSCHARADRMVLLSVPASIQDPIDAVDWVASLRERLSAADRRALAVYYPEVWPARQGPAGASNGSPVVGHIAGLMSRLDRDYGPHLTPADWPLVDVVDVAHRLSREEEIALSAARINPIVTVRGRGILARGGRTLDSDPDGTFIAHRRLVHRLVRAIRRTAAPLVFEPAGPDLRLSILRTMTTLLLETWQAGGLKGRRPEEGFRVRCDELTTSQVDAEGGRLICEISIAPAAPMEFISIRVALGQDGTLEMRT